jgi:hypothetical protein
MPDFGGGYSMNPQVAKMKGSSAPASPDPSQAAPDPLADPDVQAAIQLLQAKGVTADQVAQAMGGEPDMDQMGGASDSDADNGGGDNSY